MSPSPANGGAPRAAAPTETSPAASPDVPPTAVTQAGLRRLLIALIGGQICLHASMAGVRLAAPLMLLQQGAGPLPSEAAAGLLLGLFAAAPVLTSMPAGLWADRRGYHKPVRAAVVMVLIGALCALAGSCLGGLGRAALLILAAVLAGAGANLGLIAIQREAGRVATQTLNDEPTDAAASARRVFSWLGLAPSLSNVVGPVLAGFLIDAGGFGLAFAVLAVLPLATSLWARTVPDVRPTPRASTLKRSALTGIRELLALPGMRRLLMLNWFFSTSWDLHSFLVPLLGHERGLSASVIGSVLGVFALAVSGVRLLIPVVAHRLSEKTVLHGALALVAAIYMIYPFAQSAPMMMACAVLLGMALGSAAPMILTSLHEIAPADRQGEAMALRSAWINLSSAVLPTGFGLLGGAFGAGSLFRGMAAILMLALLFQIRQG